VDAAQAVLGLHSDAGRADPYRYYAVLHEHGRAVRFAEPVAGYDAVVHGYEAVDQVLRDGTFHLMDAGYEDSQSTHWRDHQALRTLKDSIFYLNGPEHLRIRLLFNQAFTARRVNQLRPAIIRLTQAALDRVAEAGRDGAPVDFMAEFAFPLPSNIMGELIGVPEEDRNWYRPRARAIGEILDLDTITWRTMRNADRAATELTGYFAGLVDKRRDEPTDDLISGMLQNQAEWLDDPTLFANLITVFNAGFVTTTQLFGHTVALLLRRPEMLAALRADPALVAPYVEEILRFEPPVHFVIRVATVDSEVQGVEIPAGSRVLVLIGAANRDPVRFPGPDEFDPYRQSSPQIGFGAGAHYCLGAALTRVEGALAIPMLFDRFPDLALAGEPGTPKQLTLRGYDTLPVTVTPHSAGPDRSGR
jgi:cytochrome P450